MNISSEMTNDDNYMDYVGPSTQYDFMGATQFRLLCSLGLRSNHSLLDFGCGSLRAGRLFISYLDEGLYYGIEPNKWLIEDAIKNQIGKDLIEIKKPQFDYNSDFMTDVFSRQFNFIIAQSIFSHTGKDLIFTALKNFKNSLESEGLIAATFVEDFKSFDGSGWVYPDCVNYRKSEIKGFAQEAGLFSVRIPWYHPRQAWHLLAKKRDRLPSRSMLRHLRGVVLHDPEFFESWKLNRKALKSVKRYKRYLKETLLTPIRNKLKNSVKD